MAALLSGAAAGAVFSCAGACGGGGAACCASASNAGAASTGATSQRTIRRAFIRVRFPWLRALRPAVWRMRVACGGFSGHPAVSGFHLDAPPEGHVILDLLRGVVGAGIIPA